jgi:hydroxymethylpyrimidine pyrophosphatase-like HAD family hydrolase
MNPSSRRKFSLRTGKRTIHNILIGILCVATFSISAVDSRKVSNSQLFVWGGATETLEETTMTSMEKDGGDDIKIIFSDLDGTLLHYPSKIPKSLVGNQLLKLPPSSTGMRGIISSKTLSLIQDIRSHGRVKFVLVSGMRTSTFLNRLPYLPRADAYCTEAGGRIFYPVDDVQESDDSTVYMVKPRHYDGATNEQLKPFGIREDMEWRAKMEEVSGPYQSPDLKELAKDPSKVKALKERDGLLWDFARELEHKGFVLDTKGYSVCFRVNKKQQTTISDEGFEGLLNGKIKLYEGLSSSINLSCIDVYPSASGKKNCCLYLAERFFADSSTPPDSVKFLSKHAVCLCDDDNDLEMAVACNHAYIPEISSESMKKVIERFPKQFTQTGGDGVELSGTDSTEAALLLIQLKTKKDEAPTENEMVQEEPHRKDGQLL